MRIKKHVCCCVLGFAEKSPDEMESLYNDLQAASLSVIGRSSRRDFRASFIRRCHNDKVNDKLHLLRILSSTLKVTSCLDSPEPGLCLRSLYLKLCCPVSVFQAKESELQTVKQILGDPTLTADNYRTWRLSNHLLLQQISKHKRTAGGAAELASPGQKI